MSTASARLVSLSGLSGVTAAVHLAALAASGATTGARLVAFSRLATATAAVHLMTDPPRGDWIVRSLRRRR